MHNSLKLYIVFCSIFCTIIVTGNLIFQKFITISIFGNILEISAGVLFYPLTFVISDLVTEFYGKKNAKFMLNMALICSIVVLVMISTSNHFNATKWSIIDNNTFHSVFNVYGIGAVSSIIATYLGQSVDIYLFAYVKRITKSKHLWLRNNVSTILGQCIDTITVVSILCLFKIIPVTQSIIVIFSSSSFKILAAFLSTPICYLGYYLINYFKLDMIEQN